MVYVDTSIIVKLYVKEALSMKAADWLRRNDQPIPLTRVHDLEFINALNLKRFRSEATRDEILSILSKFQEHETIGVYFRPLLDWSLVFSTAIDLSHDHTAETGARSLDILHVALALAIEAEGFLSTDAKQSKLAFQAGLKLIKF